MKHWKCLLRVDADVNLRDGESLFNWFATRISMRDGALDIDLAINATFAMSIADKLVSVFSQTPGYQCVGTRTHNGQNIVLAGSEDRPEAFQGLFDLINFSFVAPIPGTPFAPWSVVAAQPYDPEPVEEQSTDEQGNPLTIIVQRVVPYRAVPQSIRPWLSRDRDAEGNEIPEDPILTPSRLGSIQGTAEWVIEEA
jgi:hypothetical protein